MYEINKGVTREGLEYMELKNDKKPKTRYVAQINPLGEWYVYKITPKRVKTVSWCKSKDAAIATLRIVGGD